MSSWHIFLFTLFQPIFLALQLHSYLIIIQKLTRTECDSKYGDRKYICIYKSRLFPALVSWLSSCQKWRMQELHVFAKWQKFNSSCERLLLLNLEIDIIIYLALSLSLTLASCNFVDLEIMAKCACVCVVVVVLRPHLCYLCCPFGVFVLFLKEKLRAKVCSFFRE